MLEIWLESCARHGIREILINVHAHAEAVREFLANHKYGVQVHVVEETELLGSAGTLRENREWVAGEEYFWVFYADVLTRVNFSAMLRLHEKTGLAATLGAYKVPDPSRCGVLDVDPGGVVIDFVEKPTTPRSNLVFAGLLIATPTLLAAIPGKDPADLGYDVLPKLIGNMIAFPITDYLLDIGTMNNYRMAQETWPNCYNEKT
jgi:mannose-1-phosphate guanylyltransferase